MDIFRLKTMQKADVFIELSPQTHGSTWQPNVDDH